MDACVNKNMLDKRILMAFMLLAMNFGFYSRAESNLYYAAYHYNVADGLPSNEVQMLHQDEKGFIWCATNNGISRYDGYEFVNFRSSYDRQEYLSSNTILDMQEKDDKIWLVTPNGVDVFDKNTVAVTHLCPEKEVMRNIKCILPLEGGKALLGGTKGILLYDSGGYLKEQFSYHLYFIRKQFFQVSATII